MPLKVIAIGSEAWMILENQKTLKVIPFAQLLSRQSFETDKNGNVFYRLSLSVVEASGQILAPESETSVPIQEISVRVTELRHKTTQYLSLESSLGNLSRKFSPSVVDVIQASLRNLKIKD